MHIVSSMGNLYYGYYTKSKVNPKIPKIYQKMHFFLKFIFRALSGDSGDAQIQKEYSSNIELICKRSFWVY